MILSFPILVIAWGISVYSYYSNNTVNPIKDETNKLDKSLSEILNVF